MPSSPLMICILLLGVWNLINVAQGEYRCPDKWMVQGGQCYFVNSTDKLTWHQAVSKCVSLNATLAKVTTEDESVFLGRKLRRDSWIGLHDDVGDESFTWLNEGIPLNFTFWYPGEPNNASENCVSVYGYSSHRGRWSDNFCATERRYICEKASDSPGCPDKWRVFAGRCYYFSNDTQTWLGARKVCQQNYTNSDLVAIESLQENNFIKTAITRSNYWIGLNDRKDEGVFRWNDQTDAATMYQWNLAEPNNGNNVPADCVSMVPQSYRRGYWAVGFCGTSYGFVCERVRGSGCPGGWETPSPSGYPNLTSCYKVNTTLTNWDTARKQCQQEAADLLTIESQSEQYYIKSIFTVQSWIGLNSKQKTGEWCWLDQTAPVYYRDTDKADPRNKYTNWYRGEPSARRSKTNDCVVAHAGAHNVGKWANAACNMNAGYICEAPTSATCDGQWQSFNGHCYSFNVDAANWTQAVDRCKLQRADSNLIVIESEAEQTYINDFLKNVMNLPGYWIGLNCREVRGTYKWLQTTTPLSYKNWAPHSPNVFDHEACVTLSASSYSRRGRWKDQDCMAQRGYICQLDAEGDSSYYDFSLNGSVYKIVRQSFSQKEGAKFCQRLLGANSTLLRIEDEAEYNAVNAEMLLRFTTSSSEFWIEGNPQDNDTFTVLAPTRPPRHFRPYPRTTPPPNLGRQCMMMAPRTMGTRSSRTGQYTYVYQMIPRSCCEEKMLLCEKAMDKTTSERYTFEFNDSLYKIVSKRSSTAGAADAVCRVFGAFYGSGHLVRIDSEDELIAMSTELKVRHLGNQFEYWVAGDPTKNLTFSKLLRDAKPDETCLMLSHEGFPDVPWTKKTLDLIPSKCDVKKKYICELNLYQGAPIFSPSKREDNPPDYPDDIPSVLATGPGCVGPCIGLAVAFPFAIIIAVAITAVVIIYWRRRDNFGFSFHKASDEVYLTT